jgi:chorismate--pyruvate lyase
MKQQFLQSSGWHQPEWWSSARDDPAWPWLTDEGSLTEKLRKWAGQHLRLVPFMEVHTAFDPEDMRFLGSPTSVAGLRREVAFFSESEPWVFATTLIPDETLKEEPWLVHLGATPLGDRLFGEKRGKRIRLEIAQVRTGHPLYEASRCQLGRLPAWFWARRSLFQVGHHSLIVQDGFIGFRAPWRGTSIL